MTSHIGSAAIRPPARSRWTRGARWIAFGLLALTACPGPTPRRLAPLPPEATASYLRGRAAFFEGDYALAVPELAAAMAAAPDEAGIAIAHAQALARLGRKADARGAIDEVVARFPRSPEAWLAAGTLRLRADLPTDAATAFRRAIALDDTLTAAYLGLATAHTQLQQSRDAERTYRALVAKVPDAVDGHWQLARLALARDDDAAAEPALERVRALAPDHLEASRALAQLLARRGAWPEAIARARATYDRSGGDLAVGEDLLWLLLETGDRRGALELLARYDDTARPDDRVRVAALLVTIGAPAAAMRIAPRTPAGQLIAARAALATGDATLAVDKADQIDPSAEQWPAAQAIAAWAELARSPYLDGQVAARLARARRQAPLSIELLEVEAERLRRAGDLAAARAMFAAAARAQPHASALVLAWAELEARAGQLPRALRLADKVLAATPDDPAVASIVAELLVDGGGDLARAHTLLRAARRAAPGDPGILDSWGWYRRAVGDLDGAALALERAITIAPDEPVVLDHAATVWAERGDRARAAAAWATILGLAPTPELARRVRDQIARTGEGSCYADRAMTMTWLVRIALGSTLALAACQATPSKSDCEKLLVHLVDLEAATGGAGGGSGDKATKEQLDTLKAEVAKQKAAIKDYAVGQKFIETCSQKTPKKVVACGLEAKNVDELAKCDQ